MPKELEGCVQGIKKSGKPEEEAYAICAKKTGWVRKKEGGWRNEKTGKVYNENFTLISEEITFKELFEGNQQTLNWLRNNKDIIDEIKRLKSLLGKVPDVEERDLLNLIKWLERRLK